MDQENAYNRIANPSKGTLAGIWEAVLETTEERPWLWAVYLLALLIPAIVLSVFCFGRKSSTQAGRARQEPPSDELIMEDVDETVCYLYF